VKHTKKPWRIIDRGVEGVYIIAPNSIHIDERICQMCIVYKNHKANARLIASAPELLEALEKIVTIIGGPQTNPSEWIRLKNSLDVAQQAIAKAEGK